MAQQPAAGKTASQLMAASMAVTMIGILTGIYLLFVNAGLAFRVTAALLVGVVGTLSFLRHSVWYRSDQARMGWTQEHPEFQIEVGFANLAIGVAAFAASVLDWGSLACGITLFTYGTYLFCAFLLHLRQAVSPDDLHHPGQRQRAVRSTASTGFFVAVLYIFAFLAITHIG
jgi:ABC-type nickel/cobalt efflux system permease component RcnA